MFDILLTKLFVILFTTKIFKLRTVLFHTQLHTRQTEFLLTVACFVFSFYMRTSSVWWSFLKWNVRWVRILVYPYSLIFVVVGLLRTCSMYLYRVYCVHIASCCVRFGCMFVIYLFHTHCLCFCSFCLLFSCEMILGRFHLHNIC